MAIRRLRKRCFFVSGSKILYDIAQRQEEDDGTERELDEFLGNEFVEQIHCFPLVRKRVSVL
jgi:hypothetical protein